VPVASSLARAQAGAGETAASPALAEATEYDLVIRKALLEFSLAHWSESKALFQRAHLLRPSARTLRGLGLTSFELRQYVAALGHIQQALASQEHPLTDDMRKHLLGVIDDCKNFIVYKRLRLQPSEAKLQVDGEPAALDRDGSLMLDPGEHTVRAEAPGFEPQSRDLVANGGERGTLEIKLGALAPKRPVLARSSALPPAPKSAPLTASTSQQDPSFWSSLDSGKIVGLGLGAAGVIGIGLGVTFSVLALNDDSASKSHCENDACDPTGLRQRSSALSHADVATASFIAAGVCLTAGVITFIAAPGRERDRAALRLRPALGPGVASLSLAGAL
jgi:hypothetical protein